VATSPSLRVVVADDSRFMRRLLADALGARGFDVVALACDGDEALAAVREHRPDVLTLDLAMPGLDGIGVLRVLREQGPSTPVVVVSAFSPAHGARAVDALAEGALELVAKPAAGEDLDPYFAELVDKVRLAAVAPRRAVAATNGVRSRPRRAARTRRRAVVIACSTGGPRALAELMPKLPSPLGGGTLIVQHMPPRFTASLADRLDRASALSIREAADGDAIDPRAALVAPGGSHLRLAPDRTARLSDEPAIGGLRPRADLTIVDAARLYGEDLLLVVLTGMGKDGLEGAREVKERGGHVLAEAESTCTVYGMSRAVVEADLADEALELPELAAAIASEAGQ
jgi:two-component system chemotaxis response regulator CheB